MDSAITNPRANATTFFMIIFSGVPFYVAAAIFSNVAFIDINLNCSVIPFLFTFSCCSGPSWFNRNKQFFTKSIYMD